MKYSFTREKPFSNALRQPAYRSSFVIGLPTCSPHVVPRDLGRERQPAVAVGRQQFADLAQLLVDPQARQRNAHAQRTKGLLHPPHQFVELRDNRWSKAKAAKFRCSPCCGTSPRPPATIVSTLRNRSGRLMVVLWQKRHLPGQPRMISMAIRSCTHSTCGTIGASGSGNGIQIFDHRRHDLLGHAVANRPTPRECGLSRRHLHPAAGASSVQTGS